MEAIFLKLVNMSITASVMILCVILLRLLLRKAARKYCCILWMLVGLRLICPVTFESTLSLIPSAEPIPEAVLERNTLWVNTGIEAFDRPINTYFGDHYYEGVSVPVDYKARILDVLARIWLAGAAGMLLYGGINFFFLRRRLSTAVHMEEMLWQSEKVQSPFILGVFRPRIYLPFSLKEPQLTYVLAHEKAHLRRGDHFIKPLGFLLLSVYWFNPLVWLAYILLCRDLEQACDERAIQGMSEAEKKEYAKSLFSLSVRNRGISACPVAFGEVGVKERIKFVLQYKKPALWVAVLAVAGCVVAGVCFLTNPKEQENHAPAGKGNVPAGEDNVSSEESDVSLGEDNVSSEEGNASSGEDNVSSGEGNASSREDNVSSGESDASVGEDNTFGDSMQQPEELTLDMVSAMEDSDDFLQYDFAKFSNGVRHDFSEGALNYNIEFSYELDGDVLQLRVSALKEDDSLDAIYLYRESNRDMILIYSADERYTVNREVKDFLSHAYTIKDDISYRLPQGLTESGYYADCGFAGAILLLPDAYEVYDEAESFTPPEWRAAGMISRFYTADMVSWEGDVIKEVYLFYNHTIEESLGSLDGLAAPGFLQRCNHDLYTATEIGELEEQGISIPESDLTSDYWYIYMAEPGEEIGYAITLNTKNYTREDAIAFAESVKFNNR